MSYLSNKMDILKGAFMGNLMKLKALYDIRIRKSIRLSAQQDTSVIVSLTSYGKRVNSSVVYTIYSLIQQTIRPERIVLWLNEQEFCNENLPGNLRFLCNYGLEVRYAKDIRSYTKIIHALSEFADKHIITVDDDVFYGRLLVQELVEAHNKHPQAIITNYAKVPTTDIHSKLEPYIKWPEYYHASAGLSYDSAKLFPLGVGGVFYPSHVFDEEVKNEAVFTRLCPNADDVWLYVMGLRCKAKKRILTNSRINCYHTDLLRQYFTHDRLTNSNRIGGENDTQLQALLAHYNMTI